jgi:hypothetical protein
MTAPASVRVRRHPILGAFAGLALGLGLALLLISFSVIALGTMTPLLVIVLGLVVGLLVALALPPLGRSRAAAEPAWVDDGSQGPPPGMPPPGPPPA